LLVKANSSRSLFFPFGDERELHFAVVDEFSGYSSASWSKGTINLAGALDRGRLSFQHNKRPLMLSFCIVCQPTYQHVVVFKDQQPPGNVVNRTTIALELDWSASGRTNAIVVNPGEEVDLVDVPVGSSFLREDDPFLPQHPSLVRLI